MKKFGSFLFAFILSLALLTGCGDTGFDFTGGGDDGATFNYTVDEAKNKLKQLGASTGFEISLQFVGNDDETGELVVDRASLGYKSDVFWVAGEIALKKTDGGTEMYDATAGAANQYDYQYTGNADLFDTSVGASTSMFYIAHEYGAYLKEAGSATFLGRQATKYTFTGTYQQAFANVEVIVDNDTGITLKFAAAGQDLSGQSAEGSVIVTEFKTGNDVTLPTLNKSSGGQQGGEGGEGGEGNLIPVPGKYAYDETQVRDPGIYANGYFEIDEDGSGVFYDYPNYLGESHYYTGTFNYDEQENIVMTTVFGILVGADGRQRETSTGGAEFLFYSLGNGMYAITLDGHYIVYTYEQGQGDEDISKYLVNESRYMNLINQMSYLSDDVSVKFNKAQKQYNNPYLNETLENDHGNFKDAVVYDDYGNAATRIYAKDNEHLGYYYIYEFDNGAWKKVPNSIGVERDLIFGDQMASLYSLSFVLFDDLTEPLSVDNPYYYCSSFNYTDDEVGTRINISKIRIYFEDGELVRYSYTSNDYISYDVILTDLGQTQVEIPDVSGGGQGGEDQKTLQSIAVTSNPTKTSYKVGEEFSSSGLVVTAIYSDRSTAVVNGYTLNPANGYKFTENDIGQKQFVVSYQGKTTSFSVAVAANGSQGGGDEVQNNQLLSGENGAQFIYNRADKGSYTGSAANGTITALQDYTFNFFANGNAEMIQETSNLLKVITGTYVLTYKEGENVGNVAFNMQTRYVNGAQDSEYAFPPQTENYQYYIAEDEVHIVLTGTDQGTSYEVHVIFARNEETPTPYNPSIQPVESKWPADDIAKKLATLEINAKLPEPYNDDGAIERVTTEISNNTLVISMYFQEYNYLTAAQNASAEAFNYLNDSEDFSLYYSECDIDNGIYAYISQAGDVLIKIHHLNDEESLKIVVSKYNAYAYPAAQIREYCANNEINASIPSLDMDGVNYQFMDGLLMMSPVAEDMTAQGIVDSCVAILANAGFKRAALYYEDTFVVIYFDTGYNCSISLGVNEGYAFMFVGAYDEELGNPLSYPREALDESYPVGVKDSYPSFAVDGAAYFFGEGEEVNEYQLFITLQEGQNADRIVSNFQTLLTRNNGYTLVDGKYVSSNGEIEITFNVIQDILIQIDIQYLPPEITDVTYTFTDESRFDIRDGEAKIYAYVWNNKGEGEFIELEYDEDTHLYTLNTNSAMIGCKIVRFAPDSDIDWASGPDGTINEGVIIWNESGDISLPGETTSLTFIVNER